MGFQNRLSAKDLNNEFDCGLGGPFPDCDRSSLLHLRVISCLAYYRANIAPHSMNSTASNLVEIDCGNSAAKWRLLSARKVVKCGTLGYTQGFNELFQSLDSLSENIDGCRVVSVAGQEVEIALRGSWVGWTSAPICFAQVEQFCAGVRCGYEDLSQMGVDRWAAIIAASQMVEGGCLVMDAGTAITADILDKQKQHLGGYILPGIDTMLGSLRDNTAIPSARIPNANHIGSFEPGVKTSSAIANAVSMAIGGFIDRICAEVDDSIEVILTGGHARLLENILPSSVSVVPDLVLDGLAALLPMEVRA